MTTPANDLSALIQRAGQGDESAAAELFAQHRERLRRMVQLRLDRRLQGRVDPSDVMQEAYLDIARKLPEFAQKESMPFFLWLRLVVSERLLRVHRQHLGTAMRDPGREISIHQNVDQPASSEFLAAQLIGRLTSASRAYARAEMQSLLQQALDGMDPIDREVIALRHFEELGNDEVAQVLGLSIAAASKRYVRALLRLKAAVAHVPGLADFDQSASDAP
jgi:RNA polymerase sigma-70 factor (ECF subfamily)